MPEACAAPEPEPEHSWADIIALWVALVVAGALLGYWAVAVLHL